MAEKSLMDIIEEDAKDIGKKVEKNIKRNWKKIFLILIIGAILASFILFITGLRIRFAIQDKLIIYLSPSDKSFTIYNYQKQNRFLIFERFQQLMPPLAPHNFHY